MNEPLRNKRDEIIALARAHGADNVRLFGSAARDERHAESDVDILVTPGPDWTLLDRVRLKQALEDLLGAEVDLLTDNTLHPRLREPILEEAEPL